MYVKSYTRYIMKRLWYPTLVVIITLTGIVWLAQALKFIDLIVNKGVNVSTFLYMASLLIPSLLMIILPIALFCAIIFVYNQLIMDSELVIFSSAGLSNLALAAPALGVTGVVTLLSLAVSLFFLPVSYRTFKDTKNYIENNYAAVLVQEGVFSSPITGLTIYIGARSQDGKLQDILVHDTRNAEKAITYMAEEGQLVNTEYGPRLHLIKGSQQQFDRKSGEIAFLDYAYYEMDISVYTQKNEDRWRESEERYLSELFFDGTLKPEQVNKMRAEGHHRIVWPFLNFGLAMLALANLLVGQFNRRGLWKRILVTTILGVMTIILDLGLKYMVTFNPLATPLLYVNCFFVIGISLFYLYHGWLPSVRKLDMGRRKMGQEQV